MSSNTNGFGFQNSGGGGGGGGLNPVISVTYSGLVTLINASGLIASQQYIITDFRTIYDQPDFNADGSPKSSVSTITATVEPLIATALSTSEISDVVESVLFPNDTIRYDYTFNSTEVMGADAKGRITERITGANPDGSIVDTYGNRTDYDNRVILFVRYQEYVQNTILTGTVSLSGINLTGTMITVFTSELSVGMVIFINGNSYSVATITSNSIATLNSNNTNATSSGSPFYSAIISGSAYNQYRDNNTNDSSQILTFSVDKTISFDNYIGDYACFYNSEGNPFILSNNIFVSSSLNKTGTHFVNNSIDNNGTSNSFGDFNSGNIIGEESSSNIIGDNNNNWVVGANLINSNFGNNISAIIKDGCLLTIGNNCNVVIGESCSHIFIGDGNTNVITIPDNCSAWYIGNSMSNTVLSVALDFTNIVTKTNIRLEAGYSNADILLNPPPSGTISLSGLEWAGIIKINSSVFPLKQITNFKNNNSISILPSLITSLKINDATTVAGGNIYLGGIDSSVTPNGANGDFIVLSVNQNDITKLLRTGGFITTTTNYSNYFLLMGS